MIQEKLQGSGISPARPPALPRAPFYQYRQLIGVFRSQISLNTSELILNVNWTGEGKHIWRFIIIDEKHHIQTFLARRKSAFLDGYFGYLAYNTNKCTSRVLPGNLRTRIVFGKSSRSKSYRFPNILSRHRRHVSGTSSDDALLSSNLVKLGRPLTALNFCFPSFRYGIKTSLEI